jgi:hypothetical protein
MHPGGIGARSESRSDWKGRTYMAWLLGVLQV